MFSSQMMKCACGKKRVQTLPLESALLFKVWRELLCVLGQGDFTETVFFWSDAGSGRRPRSWSPAASSSLLAVCSHTNRSPHISINRQLISSPPPPPSPVKRLQRIDRSGSSGAAEQRHWLPPTHEADQCVEGRTFTNISSGQTSHLKGSTRGMRMFLIFAKHRF